MSDRYHLHYRLHVIREVCTFWRRELVTLGLSSRNQSQQMSHISYHLNKADEFEQHVMCYYALHTFNEQRNLFGWLHLAANAVSTIYTNMIRVSRSIGRYS